MKINLYLLGLLIAMLKCGSNIWMNATLNYRGYTYIVITRPSLRQEAMKTCESFGGNLVIIQSRHLQNALRITIDNLMLSSGRYGERTTFWIGLRRRIHNQTWIWENGAVCDFWLHSWFNSSEKKLPGMRHQNCVVFIHSKDNPGAKWEVATCNGSNAFICQHASYDTSFIMSGFVYGVIDHEVTKNKASSMCRSKGSYLAVLKSNRQWYTIVSRIEAFLLQKSRLEHSTSFWFDFEYTKNGLLEWEGDVGYITRRMQSRATYKGISNSTRRCTVLVFSNSVSRGAWKPASCDQAAGKVICQRKTNLCSPRTCFHGRCEDTVSGNECVCYPGVTGQRCNLVTTCNLNDMKRTFRVTALNGQRLEIVNVLPNTTIELGCLGSEDAMVGPNRVTCVKDREWRPLKDRKCGKPVRCSGLTGLDHGDMILIGADNRTMFRVGTRALFHCNQGYARKGSGEIECTDSGAWSGPVPYCAETTCVRDVNKVELNRICNKPCIKDLYCDSPQDKCLCDDWCGRSCFNPNQRCENLAPPHFGYILGTQRRFGDTVMYNCHSEYLLSGPQHRRCRSDGKWTGIAPKCLPFTSCGQAGFFANATLPTTIQKVVRGHPATRGAWPWQVMLVHNNGNKLYESLKALLGGATIINRRWILSSAHLFDGFRTNEPARWLHRVLIVVGISKIPRPGEQLPSEMDIYQPKQVLRHEHYNKVYFDYDVSLIRIGSRMIPAENDMLKLDEYSTASMFNFGKYVRPVCLPCVNDRQLSSEPHSNKDVKFLKYDQEKCETGKDDPYNSSVVVVGFGDKSPKSATDVFLRRSPVLRQGFLQVLQDEKCLLGVRKIKKVWTKARLTNRMLCTRGKDPSNLVDACVGDSGGPLLKRVVSKTGHDYWIQIGIVSWGWGCANTDRDGYVYPGYYTNVTSVVRWIVTTLKQHEIKEQRSLQSTGSERNLVVNVVVMGNKMIYRLTFRSDTTINFVKEEVENLLGYPKHKQTIFYGKKRLVGSQTLRFYLFPSGGFLSVFVSDMS